MFGIQDVDTRAITRHLRESGAIRGGIFSGDAARRPEAELVDAVGAAERMEGRRLAETVSVADPYVVEPSEHGWAGEVRHELVAVDLGIKSMTPHRFAERGVRVHVVPADTTFEQIRALRPRGVFFSNGPEIGRASCRERV